MRRESLFFPFNSIVISLNKQLEINRVSGNALCNNRLTIFPVSYTRHKD